jgi:hypothetical protein
MTVPAGLVLIDPSFVTALLILTFGLGIIITIFIIAVAISSFRTPKESKEIKHAKIHGLPLLLMVGLSHFADIFHAKDFIPEGVLEKIKGKGSKKTLLRFQLPKNQKIEEIEVASNKSTIHTREAFNNLVNMATSKLYLRHARVPIFGAVEDKAVAVGLKGLGALSFYDKLERLANLKDKIKLLKTASIEIEEEAFDKDGKPLLPTKKKVTFNDLAEVFEDFASKVSLIDFTSIRTNFVDAIFDQTTAESISSRDETVGRREAGKGMENLKQMIPYIALLIIVIGGVLGILIAVKSLMG